MPDPARVLDIQALQDVKAALAEFAAAVDYALSSVSSETQRMSQWLSQERPAYWRAQVRRRNDEVEAAKAAIRRKQIIAAPEPASIVDERKALTRAQHRLDAARRKLEATRRWDVIWDREVNACRGAWQALAGAVQRDIPRAGARLDRMIEHLEAYTRLAPAPAPAKPPPSTDTPAEESA